MNIKELGITKKMYLEAKEVEKIWKMAGDEYFNDILQKKDNDFRKKYGNDFETWEVVKEYERREVERNNNLELLQGNIINKSEVEKMRKRIAWAINLLNIVVMSFFVARNFPPVYGAVACSAAVLTVLIAVIPSALREGEVFNDDLYD